MEKLDPFKGRITLSNRTLFSYEFKTPKADVENTLMFNFKNIQFSKKEIRHLSRSTREIIFKYQHLKEKEIKQYSKKLIKEINQREDQSIVIKACETGAYICLAAIFSGKIKKHIDVSFELSSVPLQFFPKDLIKSKEAGSLHNISLIIDNNCWLKHFDTLTECPKYMSLGSHAFDGDYHFQRLAS